MVKNYKKILLLVLTLSMILGIAACGSSGTTSTDVPATPASKEPGTEESATPPAQSAATVVCVGGGLSDEEYQKTKSGMKDGDFNWNVALTDSVKSHYPNLKVKYENWGWAEQLDQKQRAAILSGNAPDIVLGETFMPTYANMDVLAPLPQDIIDMVNPNFLLKDKNGTPVGVSPLGTLFTLYVNKDLMQRAGIDPNTEIKTWDDYKRISDQITANGNGEIYGGGIPTHPHAGGALRVSPFLRQLGADFGGLSTVTVNTPEMIKALTFIREMNKNLPKGLGNNPDEGPLYNSFTQQKTVATAVNGTWMIRDNTANNINFAAFPLPLPDGGEKQNCLVAFNYFGVTNVSKNKDAAFDVLRAFLDKDVAKNIMIHDRQLVANKEALNDENNYKDVPALAVAVDEMKSGLYTGLAVWDKNDAQIWSVINSKIIARTTMTNDPIEKIVADAQAEIENLLK